MILTTASKPMVISARLHATSRLLPADRHGSLVLRDKEDICLRIEVIAYDRGKSEETDNDCDKVDANGTNDSGDTLLKEGDTRIAAESPVSGQENQEDGRGADQQGVNVDRDDLGQTLLGRV